MVLRIILGALYAAMAVGQLASWQAMPDVLGAYQGVPNEMLPWFAAALIGAEFVAGAWFLALPRSQMLAPVWIYTAVAVVWTVLGAQAYARGLAVDNCGCFGVYLTQRLTWFTLVQDGLLLLYAALMIRGGLRARATQPMTLISQPAKETAGA
ncbi:MAG TPA: hypothetical protein DGT23_08720 [Micromonosporaceae bacterium]|nr:hypothetical protein [Micromonosporaceae bacterium]